MLESLKKENQKTSKQVEIKFDELRATLKRIEFEPDVDEFVRGIIPHT